MKIFFYFENFDVIVPFYHITIAYYNWKCYALQDTNDLVLGQLCVGFTCFETSIRMFHVTLSTV